ncbi:REP-associated tyrosine transposase [Nibricoccus aquaticus]|nr:transposase [Nibricoccus aquaticus]
MEGFPIRKTLPHAVPSWVEEGALFFITVCCAERGRPQLTKPEVAERVLDALRHYHTAGDWWCRLVVLMPDHLHAILAFPGEQRMGAVIRKFKIYTAGQTGVGWQRGYFDHRLRNENEHALKSYYVRENPVRAGLVGRAEDWPYRWEA